MEIGERIRYVDQLRAVSILFLIAINVAMVFKYKSVGNLQEYVVFTTFGFGVPIFLMLLGLLMIDRDYSDIETFIKTDFLRIFIPFLIWNTLLALLMTASNFNCIFLKQTYKYDVSAYFTGQNYYKDSFASASFSVNKLNPVLSINASSINCGEDVIINVSSSVSSIEVELVIRLDNSNYYRYDSFYIYGQESRKISDLPAGSYLVQFIAPEDTKNNRAQTTVRFTVSKLASSVAVDVNDIVVGEDAVIGVSVPGIVSGVVNVTVNDESYDVAIVDGSQILIASF